MEALTAVLIAIFSVGGAGALTVLIKGIDSWRSGAARKEARAIQNLEKYRDEADWRATVAGAERNYAYDLVTYWRNRAGDAEFKIRTEWGPEHLPPVGPVPIYVPPIQADERTAITDG